MSKLNFESLRHEISHLVHGSREPLSGVQLMPMCELVETTEQLSQTLFAMCAAGQLVKSPAPEGSGRGVKFVYGPGKVKLGAAEQKPMRETKKPPREMNGRAGKKKSARRETNRAKHETNGRPSPATAAPPKGTSFGARWALTSDGAFILLGGDTEIPAPAARALIEFVRRLDAGAA